tara:strand:+ start:1707 stop:3089 length:1383 start_codon:yes stop_codon:yes gene_type:complete
MTEQFRDQGGAATMSPSTLQRWALSRGTSYLFSEKQIEKRRRKAERRRVASGEPHVVEYFHQLDDGYSHIACQLLSKLAKRYDIELRCYLVRGPEGKNVADADLLLKLSRYDAGLIASAYGVSFPESSEPPTKAFVERAAAILAAVDSSSLTVAIPEMSAALWSQDDSAFDEYEARWGRASAEEARAALEKGTQRRATLKHYSGAMFFYGGEWYWGLDRLHYLEDRLVLLGADLSVGTPKVAPCPIIDTTGITDASALTLEFYPSLRSPYTSIIFDKTVEVASQMGVNFEMRPVLPMVMRGVPATREKGMYIFFDTAREGRRQGVPYGNFYDPIGDPVRRAYSIYPWAVSQGLGTELLSSFLRHAFVLGISTNSDRGLRKVVEAAGLDWQLAKQHLGSSDWETLVEENRLRMYEAGLWGVPSYRLLDPEGKPLLEVWGQDRLWLVVKTIKDHLSNVLSKA